MTSTMIVERRPRRLAREEPQVRAGRGRNVVAKTNIHCGGERHRIRVLADGSVEAEDCLDALEDAARLGERAARGEAIGEQRGCAALVALTTIALPRRRILLPRCRCVMVSGFCACSHARACAWGACAKQSTSSASEAAREASVVAPPFSCTI